MSVKARHIEQFNKLNKTYSLMQNIPLAKECIICGSKKDVHRHHEDYEKPKEYIELCRKHHYIMIHIWACSQNMILQF